MNELQEISNGKTVSQLYDEIVFHVENGEAIGGTIVSHLIEEANKKSMLETKERRRFFDKGGIVTVFAYDKHCEGDYGKPPQIPVVNFMRESLDSVETNEGLKALYGWELANSQGVIITVYGDFDRNEQNQIMSKIRGERDVVKFNFIKKI